MMPEKRIVPMVELSEADLDAVYGGQTVVGGLIAILAQISANAAVANVTLGNFSQSTGDQVIMIG
jgi:hypothetical protein